MTADELNLLGKQPTLINVYEHLRKQVLMLFPQSEVRVHKTQISFRDPMPFCYVWLPDRRMDKSRGDTYLMVTLMLGERLQHSRVAQCVEAYPGRFTHHLSLGSQQEVDQQLVEWIRQSHAFRYMLTGGKARN